MFTNDLKKGAAVRLRNGWYAEVADNMKGNTRMCKVYGYETEIGSVYSHDITTHYPGGWGIRNPGGLDLPLPTGHAFPVSHTEAQHKLRAKLKGMGW